MNMLRYVHHWKRKWIRRSYSADYNTFHKMQYLLLFTKQSEHISIQQQQKKARAFLGIFVEMNYIIYSWNKINRIKKKFNPNYKCTLLSKVNIEITMPIRINLVSIKTQIEIDIVNGVSVLFLWACERVCLCIVLKVDWIHVEVTHTCAR